MYTTSGYDKNCFLIREGNLIRLHFRIPTKSRKLKKVTHSFTILHIPMDISRLTKAGGIWFALGMRRLGSR